MPTGAAVVVSALTREYQTDRKSTPRVALAGLDLTVESGQVHGLLGPKDTVSYLLIGNAVLIAVLESAFVVASTTWERRAGTLPLLIASPTSPVLVFCGRSVQWLVSGTASSSIALLVLVPVFGVHLPMPAAFAVIGADLRGYPGLRVGEESRLPWSGAGEVGSPSGRAGVYRPPADTRR